MSRGCSSSSTAPIAPRSGCWPTRRVSPTPEPPGCTSIPRRAVTGVFVRWATTGERLAATAARLGLPTMEGAHMSQIGNLTQFDAAAVSAAYQNAVRVIGAVEPTVADAIGQELADQRSSLKLIASENYASP